MHNIGTFFSLPKENFPNFSWVEIIWLYKNTFEITKKRERGVFVSYNFYKIFSSIETSLALTFGVAKIFFSLYIIWIMFHFRTNSR